MGSAAASPLTGSVLVAHTPSVSPERLTEIIEAVVAGQSFSEPNPPHALSAAVAPQEPVVTGRHWHALTMSAIVEQLATESAIGLQAEEAARRLTTYGRNELMRLEPRSLAAVLTEQMTTCQSRSSAARRPFRSPLVASPTR